MKSCVRGEAQESGTPRNMWRIMTKLGGLALALSGCAMPEVLALEHEMYEVESGVETLIDSGCNELPNAPGAGFGFGFGAGPGGAPVSYNVSYEFQSELVRVSAGAFGGPTAEAEYDADFLRSGTEDELFVDLGSDFALRLLNRGVDGCDAASTGRGLTID